MSHLFTLLIVDDEPAIRDGVSRLFEDEPIRLLTAKNGRDAIMSVELDKPDLVLMDLMMPSMTGVEALVLLAKKNIKVTTYIMTANPEAFESSEHRKLIDQSGLVLKLLRKPVDPDELIKIVERARDRASLRDASETMLNSVRH
jgi:CheY-like chemotaxis protein